MSTIKTQRLILRPWKFEDLEVFFKLGQDPKVMEFFPNLYSYEDCKGFYQKQLDHFEKNNWGFWAVSVIDGPDFIGFIGLWPVSFKAHFTPAIEIGYRLDSKCWGKGYATEGALAALKYGFETLNLDEIVSFTTVDNLRSQSVMKKIGLKRDKKGDFNHPKLPNHKLEKHVLYRLKKEEF